MKVCRVVWRIKLSTRYSEAGPHNLTKSETIYKITCAHFSPEMAPWISDDSLKTQCPKEALNDYSIQIRLLYY